MSAASKEHLQCTGSFRAGIAIPVPAVSTLSDVSQITTKVAFNDYSR